MKIGFIGAGKVATAFGRFLKEKNFELYGYYSKTFNSAKMAAEFTLSIATSSINEIVENCNYIFITTPDDVILDVFNQIKHFNLQDKNIFHMSGSLSSNIFEDIEDFGAYGYSLHPIFPFPNEYVYKDLDKAYFTIEGGNIERIRVFLDNLSIKYFQIPSDCKEKYHAALVFASNYIVSLSKISEELLKDCGLPKEQIPSIIFPLMNAAVSSIKLNGIENALTGPIVRGDVGTVKKHIKNIGEYKYIYSMLGEVALNIAISRGRLDENKSNEILNVLRED